MAIRNLQKLLVSRIGPDPIRKLAFPGATTSWGRESSRALGGDIPLAIGAREDYVLRRSHRTNEPVVSAVISTPQNAVAAVSRFVDSVNSRPLTLVTLGNAKIGS